MATVFLGLGSNLGNREENIKKAVELLCKNSNINLLKQSKIIETKPVGGPLQPDYLNAVIKIETLLTPKEILNSIQRIENNFKRVRTVKNGPRTIDIDILLYDNINFNEENLTIPHPRMWQRDFVKLPLFEIAPELKEKMHL